MPTQSHVHPSLIHGDLWQEKSNNDEWCIEGHLQEIRGGALEGFDMRWELFLSIKSCPHENMDSNEP